MLLYLFQNISLPPPPDLFSRIKKMTLQARIVSFLYLPYDGEGYSALMCYYWAAQLRILMFHITTIEFTAWKDIESY